jgi:hypothetical protein
MNAVSARRLIGWWLGAGLRVSGGLLIDGFSRERVLERFGFTNAPEREVAPQPQRQPVERVEDESDAGSPTASSSPATTARKKSWSVRTAANANAYDATTHRARSLSRSSELGRQRSSRGEQE